MSRELDGEIRALLARLELISHGQTQAWNPATQGGERAALLPPGESNPPHLVFRRLWDAAGSDEQRRRVIRDAERELVAWTRCDKRLADRPFVSLEQQVLEDGQGWDAAAVAGRYGISTARVLRIRLRNGRDELGVPLPAAAGEFVRLLAAEGLSQVEIGWRLGVSQPTVSRLLRFRREEKAA